MTDNVMNEEKPGTIRKNHDNRKRKLFVLISVCAAVLVCAAVFLLIFPNGRNQKIYSFPDGICASGVDGKRGYIDERGKFVIKPRFDMAYCFSDYGLARVEVGDKWGFINVNGDVVIEPKYDLTIYFDGRGLSLVRLDGEEFIINKQGERVDDTAVYVAARLAEGEFGVASVNGKYGIVNSKAEYVVEPIYDHVITHGEYAECRIGYQCVLYKMNGEHVLNLPYNEIKVFTEQNLIAVRDYDKWGVVDFEGKLVVDVQYSEPYRFNDTELIFVGSGHYVDKNGNVLHLEFEK